jgi:hypothetical protein
VNNFYEIDNKTKTDGVLERIFMAGKKSVEQMILSEFNNNDFFLSTMMQLSKLYQRERFTLEMFEAGLAPSRKRRPSVQLVRRLARSYKRMKEDQVNQPDCYKVTGLWESIGQNSHGEFIDALLNVNIPKLQDLFADIGYNGFTIGLTLSGAIPKSERQKIQFLNCLNKMYFTLKELVTFEDSALQYPYDIGIGGFLDQGWRYPYSAMRHFYYSYRLNNLVQNKNVLLEIGGGFGGCPFHLFRDHAFAGKYLNVDIPEVLVICAYFLSEVLPEKRIFMYGESDNLSLNDYDIILLPNYCLKDLPDQSVHTVFNAHSLTEVSEETVKEYFQQIERICSRYFLHMNHESGDSYLLPNGEQKSLNVLTDPSLVSILHSFINVYRLPEIIQNDGYMYPEFSYWENLFERV